MTEGMSGGPKVDDDRSLKAALRRARLSEAEHTDVIVELRAAEMARLDALADELAPTIGDLPPETDLIDCAVVPGDPPRLWIDMLGYVEMGRDKRGYRLITESRTGRQVLQETGDVKTMADHVTNYIAHRLIERDRALESTRPGAAASALAQSGQDNASNSSPRESHDAPFWQVAFSFALGLSCGVVGMIVLALFVTR